MTLLRNGRPVSTIFDLMGSKENDLTAGLAYILDSSKPLLKAVMENICGIAHENFDNAVVQIQSSRRGEGITDIEIELTNDSYAIIEAKLGPELPNHQQLSCYAPILSRSTAQHRFLVTVSNATSESSAIHFSKATIGDIPIVHLPWRSIKRIVDGIIPIESNTNKRLLTQFTDYLGELLGMENKFSNLVYVVSLGQGNPEGWNLSWIDVVEKRNTYFYPIGGGWPDPPNYLGFRYNGKLQSIRSVKSHEIFTNPRDVYPEAANVEWGPHYCLKLGAPIIPAHEVLAGPRIQRANRCWCMIDALLTSATISDALTETERRTAQAS